MISFGGIFDVDEKRSRLSEIDELVHKPDFWNDQKNAQKISKEREKLSRVIEHYENQVRILADVEAILELLKEGESGDLETEAMKELENVESELEQMEFERMLSGENDSASAILTINAGAGGTEACDWAEMILRMYRRWADSKGYANEVVDFTEGDEAGFKSVTCTISGENAYGYLKAEIGVHRLVRISPFDANKRRHTSFCSVFVIPDVEDDIEIEVRSEDLRIDTFRAGGAGGQHVNKTDSAVRITHIPTNIVVACQNERSQHQNKAVALRLLKAKLYEKEMEKKQAEMEKLEKAKKRIEWGSQIRSYVMQPYRMVKDHRTNVEVGNVDSVLDGDLDQFMRRYLLEF